MTIEEFEEKFILIREFRWMEEIAKYYREQLDMIDKNQDCFTIGSINYSCRGHGTMSINPHHPIPAKYLRDGLAEALGDLEREMATLKAEIQQ